jgi:hypothetical protein
VLLMAQAFERAGDHTKNLGEELFHLVEGRSVRHEPKRPGRYKLEPANIGAKSNKVGAGSHARRPRQP